MNILKHFLFPSLKLRDKLALYYAAVSFMLIGCVGDESSLIVIILVFANLLNAVRLANKVKFPKDFLND